MSVSQMAYVNVILSNFSLLARSLAHGICSFGCEEAEKQK